MINYLLKLFFIFILLLSPSIQAKENTPIIPEFSIGWYFPSINAMVSRTDFHVSVNMWINEFKHIVDIQHTNVKLYDHIKDMRTDFDNEQIDLIVAPPLLLVKYFDLSTLADGFTATSTTGNPYDIVVLARKKANITTIQEFKNKRLILPIKDELARVFLDSLVIPVHHQTHSQVFSSTHYTTKQSSIIHKLFFDNADIGVAYLETYHLMAELNPQILKKVEIIDHFPINSPNYSYFHHKFPDASRKYFIDEVIKLNGPARSQEIMNNFRMASLQAGSVESLTPFILLDQQDKKLQMQLK